MWGGGGLKLKRNMKINNFGNDLFHRATNWNHVSYNVVLTNPIIAQAWVSVPVGPGQERIWPAN